MSPRSSPSLPPNERVRRTNIDKALRDSTRSADHAIKVKRSKAWTEEEDIALIDCVKRGWGWQKISREKLLGRSGNSCRKHYAKLLEDGFDDTVFRNTLDVITTNSEPLTTSSLTSPTPSSTRSERVADSQDRTERISELEIDPQEERPESITQTGVIDSQAIREQNSRNQTHDTGSEDMSQCDAPPLQPLSSDINDIISEIDERKKRIEGMDRCLERATREAADLQKLIDSASKQRAQEQHEQKLALKRVFDLISHIAGLDQGIDK